MIKKKTLTVGLFFIFFLRRVFIFFLRRFLFFFTLFFIYIFYIYFFSKFLFFSNKSGYQAHHLLGRASMSRYARGSSHAGPRLNAWDTTLNPCESTYIPLDPLRVLLLPQ